MSDTRQLATREQNPQAVVKRAAEALQAFKAFKGLRFGSELDFQTAPVFHTEVTQLAPLQQDAYHDIPGGGLMPKKPLTNAIGDAVGVVFTENCGTRKGPGKYEVIGYAQGRKRMPDGTWKTSKVCEYSFDPEVRAELDFNADKRKEAKDQKYARDIDREKHLLELRKFATQRASTGASLMVIRDLANIPTAFKPHEIKQAMLFTRIALNTDELLRDPQARAEVVRMAIGANREMFGPGEERNVTPTKEALPAPDANTEHVAATEADDSGFEEVEEQAPFMQADDPRKPLRDKLSAILGDKAKRDVLSRRKETASGKLAVDLVSEALSDESATVESLESLLKRCDKLFSAQPGNGGAA